MMSEMLSVGRTEMTKLAEKIFEACRAALSKGASFETLIQLLRAEGLSKVHSMKALVDLGLADLVEAKRLVHESGAWTDVREQDEDFQKKLGDS